MGLHAIVLAAGIGRRMRPLTDHQHKALLDVAGEPILDRILAALAALGINEVTIATGYRAQEVETHARTRFPSVALRFVRNERFETTNNIASLSLALDSLTYDTESSHDLVFVECDLVFAPELLQHLLGREGRNVALVDRFRAGMDGTVVAVEKGMVVKVFPPEAQGEDFSYTDKFKTLNIYRFDHAFARDILAPLVHRYATLVDANAYYETALAILVNEGQERIEAEIVTGETWAEVDDPNDLASARFTFDPKSRFDLAEESYGGYWNFDFSDFAYLRNLHFPTPGMMAALRQALPALLTSYGSGQSVLDAKMALAVGCDPTRIRTLNGASQAFPWLRDLWPASQVLMPRPTFGEYMRAFPESSHYTDAPGISWDEIEHKARAAQTIVFVNPNSPTGTLIEPDLIFDFAAARPDKTVLVDESFIDFSGRESLLARLERNPLRNVVILKSLSKSLGVPGARLGFLYSHDEAWLKSITNRIPIWNLGSVAEHVLDLFLKFRPEFARSLEMTALDREAFAAGLSRCAGVDAVHPSAGNFLLVRLHGGVTQANRLARRLMAEERIYVKDVSNRISGGAGHIRLAVRTESDNARLLEALERLGTPRHG